MASSFKHVITRKLECPVCLTVFTDPRSLTCHHTFCKECLARILRAQPSKQKLPCPVCREVTTVPGGDVNQLQINKKLYALVDDAKNRNQICTSCDGGEKAPAIAFCQECDMDMCGPCHKVHAQWKKFAGHHVVGMNEMVAGTVALKRRRKCKKHPTEDEECFCADCQKHVCFRCGMLEHATAGHRMLESNTHQENLLKNINELKSRASLKKASISKYINFIDNQRQRLNGLLKQLNDDVDKAYDESVQQLTKRREFLKGKVQRRIEELGAKLQGMAEDSRERIIQVDTVEELVTNGTKIPLKKKAIAAHETLCQELERILGGEVDEFDYENPTSTAKEGEKLRFVRNVGNNELELGQVRDAETKWILGSETMLPIKDCMNGMAATPDGMMAIGSQFGGIYLFSVDGQHGSGLNGLEMRAIACLSDGRYAVRDDENNIHLFSRQLAKINIRFATLSDQEGGPGGLTVDSEDNVYASYMKTRSIQIFASTGGQALRIIPCDDFVPMQISALKSKMLVVRSSANSARVIDAFGRVKSSISKDGKTMAYPTACADGMIIIAWVRHDAALVTIDQFTADLKHVKTLVADQKIQKPEKRNWYFLQKFRSGEIALSSPDKLYVFSKVTK